MHHPHRSFAKPGRHDTESRNDPPLEKPLAGEEKLPRMGFLKDHSAFLSPGGARLPTPTGPTSGTPWRF
jgi:hypothetical protein